MAAIVGAVIGLMMALVKIIERLLDAKMHKKAGPTVASLTDQERVWLRELHQMHSRFDDDGVPVWYVPRSWITLQERMGETLNKIGESLRGISGNMQKSSEALERLEDRVRDRCPMD